MMRATLRGLRAHQNVAIVGTLVLCAIIATGVVVIGSQPTKASTRSVATHAGHQESSGPVVEVPPDGVGGISSRAGSEQIPTTTTSPAPKPAAAPKASSESKSSVSTTPLPVGDGLGVTDEAKEGLPQVKVSLPATLMPPTGSTLTHDPVKFPNGVLQWVYVNPSLAYSGMLAAMRIRVTTNGWRITATEAPFSFPSPSGGTVQSQRLYVANGSMRGYVEISGKVGDVSSQVQIDLLGV